MNSTVHSGREENLPWSFWSPGRSIGALQSLAAHRPGMAHICGTAAGPADRGLVWPGWPGAAGEQEYCPGITWLWSGSSVVQCSHERSCCSFYMLKQTKPQPQPQHAGPGGAGLGRTCGPSSCPLAAPAAQSLSPGQLCLSPFPALSLLPQ